MLFLRRKGAESIFDRHNFVHTLVRRQDCFAEFVGDVAFCIQDLRFLALLWIRAACIARLRLVPGGAYID